MSLNHLGASHFFQVHSFRGSEYRPIKCQLFSLCLPLFHSAQCLVEMERNNAQSNVVEGEANVTVDLSHKLQQIVILVHVRSGKLETGVRYIISEQGTQGLTTL